MNIIHVTPHLGGGVGRVVLSWLEHEGRNGGNTHSICCLEETNERATGWAAKASIPLCTGMNKDLPALDTEIAAADIVVVHWWNHPVLWNLLVNHEFPFCRLVLWSHVSGHTAPQVFTASLVQFPDLFVAASPFSLESPVLRELPASYRDQHVRVVFSCAGVERVAAVRPCPHEGFIVGYIGTVDYCKLHPSFLKMSAAAESRSTRFVVVGGDRHEQLRREACDEGFSSLFEFVGPVADITPYLSTFDVFGYPLCDGHYGTGEQALLEAMGAGLPVVVMGHGPERCLVANGETGLIAFGEQEYSEHIEMLRGDRALRQRLGRRARKYAQRCFSLEAMAEAWIGIFEEAMGSDKCSHSWPADDPVGGAGLFLESYGLAAGPFAVSFDACAAAEQLRNAEVEISILSGALSANTRGSVFHYRSFFPSDPYLNFWCGLMEAAHGLHKEALDSFKVSLRGGVVRAKEYQNRLERRVNEPPMITTIVSPDGRSADKVRAEVVEKGAA